MFRNFALAVACLVLMSFTSAPSESELRLCLHSEPRTFDPLLVEDEASETIRYLTAGVLVRLNRHTQQPEAELAVGWKVLDNGRRIDLQLRRGVRFSDGTPFTAADVAYTMRRVMDPALHTAASDAFRSGTGAIETTVRGSDSITIRFPAPLSALPIEFDQLPILSAASPLKEKAVLGPFVVTDYKPGNYVLLHRNPNYWKSDESRRPLPYVSSVRLYIQQNRELELLRFERGEIDLIPKLDPPLFERLSSARPGSARDIGPGLDTVALWFNQTPAAPLDAWKRTWYASANFRKAVSLAINRDDLCRVVWRGHARPAAGSVSPANRVWFNSALKPDSYSPDAALALLRRDGFHLSGTTLYDRAGHRVEFSLMTNSGNALHERALAMIRQDLAKVGIAVNPVTLDFPSLIERITRTFSYDACLLPMLAELDPTDQMNLWLSSAENHQWNPAQKTPATPWEAEIDRLMTAQAAAADPARRKEAFDRVQAIAAEQAPIVFLVHPNMLVAVGARVRGADPVILRPQVLWNVDRLEVTP